MIFSRIYVLFFFFSPFILVAQTPCALNEKRELFVDNYFIDKLTNVVIKLHTPIDEGIVFNFDNPWEGDFSGYVTIINDNNLYRLYYRGVKVVDKDGNENEVTCYAESNDGMNWIKPNLKLHVINETLENNVILANAAPVTHNFTPFFDRNPNSKHKFKALGGIKISGLIPYGSNDGVNWDPLQKDAVIKKGVFDSQNVSFWSESENQYVCYFRVWSNGNFSKYRGYRSIARTTSKDFINWSEPIQMTFEDTPREHFYTNQTSPYFRAPHIYVAIGARFMPNRQVLTKEQAVSLNVNPGYFRDCSDVFLMTSRGDSIFNRLFMEAFIRPGIGLNNWVSRSNYPALNVVQTSPTEMSLYINQDYAQPTAHLRRYSLRLDGFTSLNAPDERGMVVTKNFTFSGKELEINYSTSAAGELKIEIQDHEGKPIPGFAI